MIPIWPIFEEIFNYESVVWFSKAVRRGIKNPKDKATLRRACGSILGFHLRNDAKMVIFLAFHCGQLLK